jgi:hypothetical protein
MDEVDHPEPNILPGIFVNLFDAGLEVLMNPVISADSRWLLYDLERRPDHPGVIASAGRLRDERFGENTLTFVVESMAKTTCAVRAYVPARPDEVSLRLADGSSSDMAQDWQWDATSETVLINFAGDPRGIAVEVNW